MGELLLYDKLIISTIIGIQFCMYNVISGMKQIILSHCKSILNLPIVGNLIFVFVRVTVLVILILVRLEVAPPILSVSRAVFGEMLISFLKLVLNGLSP